MPAIAAHAEGRRLQKSKRHACELLAGRETREVMECLENYGETRLQQGQFNSSARERSCRCATKRLQNWRLLILAASSAEKRHGSRG